jgi:ubiquitin-activating enzyme E1 C
MLDHPVLGKMLAHPSISYEAKQLYARGVFEAETRPNLGKPVAELLDGVADGPVLLTVNDKKLSAPLRVRLRLK